MYPCSPCTLDLVDDDVNHDSSPSHVAFEQRKAQHDLPYRDICDRFAVVCLVVPKTFRVTASESLYPGHAEELGIHHDKATVIALSREKVGKLGQGLASPESQRQNASRWCFSEVKQRKKGVVMQG